MLSLGPIAFAAPWMLVALLLIPAIWWLLRVTPPAPKRIPFPPLRLLLNIRQKEETPAHTPLWLVLLRMTAAALVILALAQPLWNPDTALRNSGPLVLVVDNSWAAAHDWDHRRTRMERLLALAERQERPVFLLPTAPHAESIPPEIQGPMTSQAALGVLTALAPLPWHADHAGALTAVEALTVEGAANVFWVSDGLQQAGTTELAVALQRLGGLDVVAGDRAALPPLLLPPQSDVGGLTARVVRPEEGPAASLTVRALADNGRVLDKRPVTFAADETEASVLISLPAELRNQVARLDLEDRRDVGGVVLLDERWRRRPVGLVKLPGLEPGHPLLSDRYYLMRALAPYGEIREGDVGELLQRPLAILVLTDTGPLPANEQREIENWIDSGGVLVRFAGPVLAEGDDPLVPVRLRRGDRSFGGTMSWTEPMSLAAIDEASPLAGLDVPDDVAVRRQVLAEPALDLAEKAWLRLADGTPLVTAEARGRGWLVLVHTMANTEWSNLPISGFFVQMLRRFIDLSQGVAGTDVAAVLPPLELLDAFGVAHAGPGMARPIQGSAFEQIEVSAGQPPGYYGNDTGRRSLNLTKDVQRLEPLAELPVGVVERRLAEASETDLKPWLLAAALVLLIADWIIGLGMRGLLPAGRGATPALVVLTAAATVVGATPASAQNDEAVLEAVGAVRLAYVQIGDTEADRVSEAALTGLGQILRARTSVEPEAPIGVDPARDELVLFPLLYWPVTERQPPPGSEAVRRLNRYIASGGVLVFDIRGGGTNDSGSLRRITRELKIPPLVRVDDEHVLTKSFYLLRQFPGRWTGGTVWVEPEGQSANDGVSSVVVSTNDWGGAWAVDTNFRPMFAVVPGGEVQREQAYRSGVNLVMYALTGNYKADQVHLPTILQRLGQ